MLGGTGGEAERETPNRPPPKAALTRYFGENHQNPGREAGHASGTSNGKAMWESH